jgi:putative flippase GtrA
METRKLALEIGEKQKEIVSGASPADKLEMLVAPLGNNQLALLILVRFVLLYLTLELWDLVPAVFSTITSLIAAMVYGAIWLFQSETSRALSGSAVIVVVAMLPAGLRFIFSIVSWSITLGFGWPLFKDTCAFLNIPIKSLFDLPTLWRRAKFD